MDVSNLSLKSNSVAQPTVKSAAAVEKSIPATSGNSLPIAQSPARTENSQAETSPPQADRKSLDGLVDQANQALQKHDTALKFTVADGTDVRVIRIVDSKTGDVIRQIPSEQMVAIAEAIKDEMKRGSVLEERV